MVNIDSLKILVETELLKCNKVKTIIPKGIIMIKTELFSELLYVDTRWSCENLWCMYIILSFMFNGNSPVYVSFAGNR